MNKTDALRINIKKAQWARCLIGIDKSCKKIVDYIQQDEERAKDIERVFKDNGLKLEIF